MAVPCLSEVIAQWMPDDVLKHRTLGIAPPNLAAAREGGWGRWTEAYRPLLQMEVWREVHDVWNEFQEILKNGGQGGSTCKLVPNGNEWCFEDGHSKHFANDMNGMVIALRKKDGTRWSRWWLGVFVDDSRVVLNKQMTSGYRGGKNDGGGNDTGGRSFISVNIVKLMSITSLLRMYRACTASEEPKFGAQLRGVSAPENQQANSGTSGGQTKRTGPQLNKMQENAVNSWVPQGKGADPPSFMLLQGPPGTGKTTTAVEILRRSLKERCRLGSTTAKIVCVAPSWTAVYQYVERFMCRANNTGCRIAMTGCTDGTRAAADEPDKSRGISVASLMRDIRAWIDSFDRTYSYYLKDVKGPIEKRAPYFYETYLKGKVNKDKLDEAAGILRRVQKKLKAALLKEATVIFSTLNGLGAPYVIEALEEEAVQTLIVDEAGQVTDPDLFIGCQLKPKRLLLIGDHRQLPPHTKCHKAQKSGLGCSSLERLHDSSSHTMLKVQYRMAPEILLWPNRFFYNGKLCNSPFWEEKEKWKDCHYRLVDVPGKQHKVGTSYRNADEAAAIVLNVMNLHANRADVGKDVLVITPYSAQRRLVEMYLRNYLRSQGVPVVPRIMTVDSCQGAECEHVILSLTRTHGLHDSFAGDKHRLCVAMTRAKQTMTVLCNVKAFEREADTLPRDMFVADAVKRKVVEKLPQEPRSLNGKIVGMRFVAFGGGDVVDVGELGYRVIDGDTVELRVLDAGCNKPAIVVDVHVLVPSPMREKPFVCQLVNDCNVCFEAPSREERVAILHAVRDIAAAADGKTCNGCKVVACDRQPVDDRFFTLTVADHLLANRLMKGQEQVVIRERDEDGQETSRTVQACTPQEPHYNKFVPLDGRLPLVRIPTDQVIGEKVTCHSTVLVKLAENKGLEEDVWYADIIQPSSKGNRDATDMWLECLTGDDSDELQTLQKWCKDPTTVAEDATPAHYEGPEVRDGDVFTIDQEGTVVFDDALSCTRTQSGWDVVLYITDPSVADDMRPRLRKRMTDICLKKVNGGTQVSRLMPEDVLKQASLCSGQKRTCLAVKFQVQKDGTVSKTKFSTKTVTVKRNFHVTDDVTWDDFEKLYEPGDGPRQLEEAVSAMKGRQRFFEETMHVRTKAGGYRASGGPLHVLQYIVVLAKRAAAQKLSAGGFQKHVLFRSSTVPVREAALLFPDLPDSEGVSETDVCRAAHTALQDALGTSTEIYACARIACVRKLATTEHLVRYTPGSTVSFTSPLRKYNDYRVLQLLKLDAPRGRAPGAAELYGLKRDEDHRNSCVREINGLLEEATACHNSVVKVRVLVTSVDGGGMHVYCPKTDIVFPAQLPAGDENIKEFETMYTSRLVTAGRQTYLRYRQLHVVIYDPPQSNAPQSSGGAAVRAPQRMNPKATKRKKPVSIRFAGENRHDAQPQEAARVLEVIRGILDDISPGFDANSVRVDEDWRVQSGWLVMHKIKCARGSACSRGSQCWFWHGREEQFGKDMVKVVRHAAEIARGSLRCPIRMRPGQS
eukprot:TRINITY_DN403_c0_g1_i12.p1 TRINITY_DN403_c0_g1~~TRINITY_DN403_c0_g1_i12.p1  ORF type:complete len:1519 (+),score=380.13 TRINITY_DN403_c0_g1_i12:1436-5992(+)